MLITVTVSQLNRYIKAVFEEDKKLSDLYVKGEISNYTHHRASGHLYFSMKDGGSTIKAVMFKGHAQDLRFEPENGMSVLVRASLGVYERDGVYQLYVTDIQPEGVGAYAVAFEQIRQRLLAQGLFDERHKKPLPALPRRIGVVTSETGAALQDIINMLSRRWPLCTLVVSNAAVQGKDAPIALVKALQALDIEGSCDIIIIGRGGGSAEDLWCFNDEDLARAVFAAITPVISAVGHETDYTICDFVADLRAPTPSAAAELATPSMEQLIRQLAAYRAILRNRGTQLLSYQMKRLKTMAANPALRSPMEYIIKNQEKLDFFRQSLYNEKCIFIRQLQGKLEQKATLLDSLSPLRVLERGYCMCYQGERAIFSVEDVRENTPLSVQFHDGTVQTAVERIERGNA